MSNTTFRTADDIINELESNNANRPAFFWHDGRLECNVRRVRVDKALDLSILKWNMIIKRLQNGDEVSDTGSIRTCGLCKVYNNEVSLDVMCELSSSQPSGSNQVCPVKQYTGVPCCYATPYWEFEHMISEFGRECEALNWAISERNFLLDVKDWLNGEPKYKRVASMGEMADLQEGRHY